MKKIIYGSSVILTIILIIAALSNRAITTSFDVSKRKLNYSSTYNEQFTSSLFGEVDDKLNKRNYYIERIDLSIDYASSSDLTGVIRMLVNGVETETVLNGNMLFYDELSGYVGVFDGELNIDGKKERITIDVLFISEKDNFTTVTMGTADDTLPQILCFGDFSETISELSSLNVRRIRQERDDEMEIIQRIVG